MVLTSMTLNLENGEFQWFCVIFGCRIVKCDEIVGDKSILAANRNCHKLSHVSWALAQIFFELSSYLAPHVTVVGNRWRGKQGAWWCCWLIEQWRLLVGCVSNYTASWTETLCHFSSVQLHRSVRALWSVFCNRVGSEKIISLSSKMLLVSATHTEVCFLT